MILFILLALILVSYSSQSEIKQPQSSLYLILAPKVIRPGRPFEVSLSISDTSETVPINVMIKKDEEIILKDTAHVSQYAPQTIIFHVPDNATNGKYILKTFGISPSWRLVFYNETLLEYKEKTASLFIQTDKAVYKAGQKVNFRVIGIDQDLKPYSGPMGVVILDAKQNRIQQWSNESSEYGVISHNLQLSDQPVLGVWTIIATIKNEEKQRLFSVDEYVLPKFEVTIEVPRIVLFADQKITAVLKARYTFGKPVNGFAEIILQTNIFGQIIIMQSMEVVDGQAVIEMPMKHLLTRPYNLPKEVSASFTAHVTEAVTNITLNGTVNFNIYANRIKLEIFKTSNSFKPGLPYTFFVKVKTRDDLPLPGKNNMVNISTGFFWERDKFVSKLYRIPEDGLVQVDVDTIPDAYEVRIIAQYGGDSLEESVWVKFQSPTSTFLNIITPTEKVKVGNIVDFHIRSTLPLTRLDYVVLARSNVVLNGVLQVNSSNSTDLNILITRKMLPSCSIVIYHIAENGEVVTAGAKFEVQDNLINQINLAFTYPNHSKIDAAHSVQPGDKVLISGKTSSKAFVGILTVDQSVKLLKSNNDITKEQINQELASYDLSDTSRPWYVSGLYGTTAADILQDAGVVVLTNGYIHSSDIRPHQIGYHSRTRVSAQPVAMASVALMSQDNRESIPLSLVIEKDSPLASKVRQLFPETWMWLDIYSSKKGTFEHKALVPDTITKWIATAISIDKEHGLSLSEEAATLKVFKPMFVSMNLPYSVIRGEILHLQILLFNYLKDPEAVTVSLQKNNDFSVEIDEGIQSREISVHHKVKPGDIVSTVFNIIPTKVGLIELKASGSSSLGNDTEIRQLIVKPEGVTIFETKSWLLHLNKSQPHPIEIGSFSTNEANENGVVQGSKRVEISAIGDLMGLSLQNLGNLVRVPYGCGEQNMVNFVPNVLVLNYLSATNQMTNEIKIKAISHLRTGYQRQLTYKRNDGSFSAFGNRDASGSTWLTAFVLRSFYIASKYIEIDPKVFNSSIAWLLTQQNINNSFTESGRILDAQLQGGATSTVTLTAYVLVTLFKLKSLEKPEILMAIEKSKAYLESQLDSLEDVYAISIVTSALHLVESNRSDAAFHKLKSLSKSDSSEGTLFWKKQSSGNSNRHGAKTVDVETTSYALLTYVKRNKISDAARIVKWLSSQRNSHGGFQSTQDTVIGLLAMSLFAKKTYYSENDMNIIIKEKNHLHKADIRFHVTKKNSLILQSVVLPSESSDYTIFSSGKGAAYLQLSIQYNVVNPEELNSFNLDLTVTSNDSELKLQVCASNKKEVLTGMVVMEIALPSGYIADKNSFNSLINNNNIVKRIETRSGDSEIIAYFDEISKDTICLEISADRIYIVDNIKEVPVVIYEFYDPDKRTTKFYKP